MRLLYIVTKGTDDTTLASVPLHIAANGSLEIGQEVSVVLAGDATDSFLFHRTTWRGPSRQLVCTIVNRKRDSRLRGRQRLKLCRTSEHNVWCRRV